MDTVTVFRLLHEKTEIDGNTLIALCNVTIVGGAMGSFAKLGSSTDGTSVSILMHIRNTTRRR